MYPDFRDVAVFDFHELESGIPDAHQEHVIIYFTDAVYMPEVYEYGVRIPAGPRIKLCHRSRLGPCPQAILSVRKR